MTRSSASLRRFVAGLDWAGMIGMLLLAAALVAYLATLRPLQQELVRLRTDAETARARSEAGKSSDPPRPGDRPAPIKPVGTVEQLAAFYGSFPNASSSPEWLARISAIARSKGINLQSGEYKVERQAGHKLARYQITLPVTGTYAQIRGFLAEVLIQVPAAALEDVTLRRDAVGSTQLEARIRLTLYLASG